MSQHSAVVMFFQVRCNIKVLLPNTVSTEPRVGVTWPNLATPHGYRTYLSNRRQLGTVSNSLEPNILNTEGLNIPFPLTIHQLFYPAAVVLEPMFPFPCHVYYLELGINSYFTALALV